MVVSAVALVLAVSGCGGDQTTSAPTVSSSGSAASSPTTAWRTRSELQTELFRSFIYSAHAWSAEPHGDVRVSSGDPSTLVFAKVVALPDSASRVRFDCCQYYNGRAASRAARRDGIDPTTMNSTVYVRNRFVHVQELPVASECPVVTTADGDHVQNGFGGVAHARMCYWLIIGDDGKIQGALWQPTY